MSDLDIRQLAADRLHDDLVAARRSGDFVAVARLAREAIALVEAKHGAHHPASAEWWCELGEAQLRLGEWVAADATLARAEILIGPQGKPTQLAEIWFRRGDSAARRGDYVAAEKWLRQAIAKLDAKSAASDVITVHGSLASVLRAAGNSEGAGQELAVAIDVARQADEPWLLARALSERAEWAVEARDFVTAEQALAEAVQLHREHPEAPLAAAQVFSLLGEVLEATARFADSVSCYETARDLLALQLQPDHPQLGVAELNIATARRRAGQPAETAAQAALRIFVVHFGAEHSHTSKVMVALADLFGAEQARQWLHKLAS